MHMAFKEKEFIEIEYTGRLKEDGIVFDTTDAEVAKKEGFYNENLKYGPIVICLGEKHILPGLDKRIIGKEAGEYEFELKSEEAFGKKDAKMIQLIPTAKFKHQNIRPMPGLQINIDGMIGIVRAVSGGRTIVDFNNPLASKEVAYKIKVNKKVDDIERQIEAILSVEFHLKKPAIKAEGDKVTMEFEDELPKVVQDRIAERIKLLTSTKNIAFSFSKGKNHQ